ncbi:hypothetical protein D3C73_1362090 [compost metagenome]
MANLGQFRRRPHQIDGQLAEGRNIARQTHAEPQHAVIGFQVLDEVAQLALAYIAIDDEAVALGFAPFRLDGRGRRQDARHDR